MYNEIARSLEKQYNEEELKEHYPVSWLLLELADENGFYVRATAFNDFDIISLTYRDKKGSDIIVPVNMTPIDIGPDVVGPTRTTWSDFEIFLGDLFEPILTLLGILFVLLVIIVLAKPVGWIIDRLFGRRKQ